MGTIHIDWDELATAFNTSSEDAEFYLDCETAEIVMITADIQEYARQPDNQRIPDWAKDDVRLARDIWQEQEVETEPVRYIPIPPVDTSDHYHDMETFISTVHQKRLQGELAEAIRGKGAFKRFKDALSDHEQELKRWYTWKEIRTQERMNEWLAMIDIVPENPRQPRPEPQPPEPPQPPEVEHQELVEELTILLLWLCSWEEKISPEARIYRAWKGYPFEVLNTLEERGLIIQSRKAKSVTLTEEGIELARELEERLTP